jgi:large subunit ribosomal protein L31
VISVGGTQEKYVVDVWSGNHPFYQGNKTTLLLDADRVDKFTKRYGALGNLSNVPILDKGEIIFEKKKKPLKKGGKK